MESWFGERFGDVNVLSQFPVVKQAMKDLSLALKNSRARGYFGLNILKDPEYMTVHNRYHSILKNYEKEYGYYDVFLITKKGDIAYTVEKESDFGEDLSTKSWHIKKVWQGAKEDKVTLGDFERYKPSNDAPACFIAAPIKEAGSIIGVLALQMPLDAINNIMQERSGLGESGETYLVGEDNLMRSDSRFLKQGEGSVLKQEIDTETANKALKGGTGEKIVKDYRGIKV